MPGFRELLRRGAQASGNGLLTQAPPNTGAGWFTLATGAWPGVHGSTNNTFHINGAAVRQRARRAAFDPGVLQAETLAQAAERGGKKVAQIEWAGGRSGAIDGPDARLPQLPLRPRRGDELHRARPTSPTFTASFGLQFDHPAGFAGQRAVPAGRAGRRDRLDRRARAPTARRRRCACACSTARRRRQVRPQRLHLRQPRRRPDALRPRPVLAAPRTATTAVGDLARGRVGRRQGHDPGRATLDGKTGAFLVKVERLAPRPLAGPPVPHVGHARDRDLAGLAGRARLHRHLRGLRRRALPVLAGRRLRRARGRHRQRGDLHRAGRSTGRRPTTR